MAGLMMCLFSSNLMAEFYLSAGVPFSYTFAGENSDGEKFDVESVKGGLYHMQFSAMFGIGLETYQIKLKDPGFTLGELSVATTMYDLFYTLPIPAVIISIGVGFGQSEFECDTCSDVFNEGTASQLYLQFGYPITPFMDLHLSYHQVASKITSKITSFEADLGGNLAAIGFGLSF